MTTNNLPGKGVRRIVKTVISEFGKMIEGGAKGAVDQLRLKTLVDEYTYGKNRKK